MSSNSFLSSSFLFCIAVALTGANSICAQDDENDKPSAATIKGKLTQNSDSDFEIELSDLKPMLNQQVQLPSPQLPDNWSEMNVQQRQNWFREFEASDKGKALIEKRKAIAESAERFELQLDDDGTFTVYDVPPGTYGLRGRLEKEVAGASYVFEVFGQIQVSDEVEEVLLDPIDVLVTRLLKTGEQTPAFAIPTFDGKATIDNKLISDRNVLLSFWSLNSPPSLEFSKQVQSSYQDMGKDSNLQLLCVCVDSDRKEALEFVRKNRIKGWQGFAKTWNHEMVNEFGVRTIPALFLIGADGQIKLTHGDFQRGFRLHQMELKQIIADGLSGKVPPMPAAPAAPQK